MYVAGECVARMASGERWQDWVGAAAACPSEFPFWTIITLPDGSEWYCLDRGGKIKTDANGVVWIDLLEEQARYAYGTQVEVTVE